MAFERARSGRTRPMFWLEIDGFATVFYSGDTAPTLDPGFTAIPGLLPPTALTASTDLKAATARPSTCSVRVGRRRDYDISDFRRRGPDGATRFATLAATVERGVAGPYTIEVNEDITAWPATGTLWVGQEAMLYASKDNALRTFTVNGVGRGYLNSQVQEHKASPSEGWAPRVYSECVHWTNRRGRIWTDEVLADGTLAGEARCEIDGWIKGAPIESSNADYEVQLTSVASALDIELGGEELRTGLQHGWHAFDGENAHRFDTLKMVLDEGAFSWPVTVASAAGGGAILGVRWDPHQRLFDPTLSDARAGLVTDGSNTYQLAAAPYVGNGIDPAGLGSLTITGVLAAAIPVGTEVKSALAEYNPRASLLTAVGAEEVVGWPGESLERLFGDLTPGGYTGATGLWADIDISLPRSDLAVIPNVTTPTYVTLSTVRPGAETCVGICIGEELPYPVGEVDWRRGAPGWARVLSGVRTGSERRIPIRGVPSAWHSVWEKYIHADDDVFSTPSAAAPIFVEARFQFQGEDKVARFKIVGKKDASTITAGTSGTLLEKAPGHIGTGLPLADWPGLPSVELRQVVSWDEVPPTTLMLQLLMSGEGNGYTSATYDVLPFGVGLESSQVDIASFERYTPPAGAAGPRTFTLDEGVKIGEMLSGLAKSIGAVLVEKLDRSTGRRKIALARAGLPIRDDAAADLTNWALSGSPRGTDDESVINSVEAQANWQSGEPQLTVTVNDRDGISRNNGTARETLRLYGVNVRAESVSSQRAAVLPIAAERFGLFGYRRIIVTGGLSYSDALLLDPGSVVTFTADKVDDYDGSTGITDGVGIVQSITRTPATQQARVSIVYWGARVSGWAPAMKVANPMGATPQQLTVEANAYSEAAHPVTGEAVTDAGFFRVGDAVEIVPVGDWPNRVTTTITAIAGNVITFAAAHGAAAGDTIRPQSWDSVATLLQGYIFAADADDWLGAANDPAWVYS